MKQWIGPQRVILFLLLIGVILFPIFSPSPYLVHVVILILLWSFIVTVWSYMGRFGIVSLCHGAFMGIGAYSAFLLFNFFKWSPWLGMGVGVLLSAVLAGAIGYACFRFGVIGHYFAITTLVIGELVTLVIVAFRGATGGRLGLTLKPLGSASPFIKFFYLQFESKLFFYYFALLLLMIGLYIWKKIDQSKIQIALKAIGDDEVAAASVGIPIVRYKTAITVLSAILATVGGVVYGQYISYFDPISMVGSAASLGICFKAILGGMFTLWGPTIGTILIVSLEEYVRVYYGTTFIGYSYIGYAVIIILLIIFLPGGLHGSLSDFFGKREKKRMKESGLLTVGG
jgi:branched-chain amino acid transport system permease protein